MAEIFRNLPVDLFIIDRAGRLQYAHPRLLAALDRQADHLTGQPFEQALAGWCAAPLADACRAALAGQHPPEAQWFEPDHRRGWKARALPLESGALVTVSEITAEIQSGQFLNNEQGFIETALRVFPALLYVLDLQDGLPQGDHFELVNQLGYTSEQIAAMPRPLFNYLMHPDDAARFKGHLAALERLPDGHKASFEYRVRSADGSWRWYRSQDSVFKRGPDGRITQMIGSALDVHNFRETIDTLRSSEQKFRQLADAMPQLVWTARPDGTPDYYNQKYREYRGIEPDGDVWQWAPVMHPDDLPATSAAWQRAVETGTPYEIEHRVYAYDGSLRWVLSRGVPVHDEQGRVVRWFGTATDIHEQKLAQLALADANAALAESNAALAEANAALRVSEQRFRLAAHATSDVVWDWDLRSDQVHWNDAIETIFGYEEALANGTGITWWEERIHPDDCQRVVESIHRAVAGLEDHWAEEYRFQHASGEYAAVFDRGWLLRAEDGQPLRMIGAIQDVTERYQAQQALRESEERFRGTFENAPVGIAHVAVQGQLLRANERLCQKMGFSIDQLRRQNMAKLIHPADYPALRAGSLDVYAGKLSSFRCEARFLRQDGRIMWAIVVISMQRSASGEPLYYLCVVQDISDLKKLEEQDRFLLEIGDRLATAATVNEVIEVTVNSVGQFMSAARCMVSELDFTRQVTFIHRDYCPGLASMHGQHSLAVCPPEVLAELQEGRQVSISDLTADPRTSPHYEHVYHPNQVRSYLFTPQLCENHRLEALLVTSSEPRVWAEEEMRLLRSVARLVWLTLEKVRALDSLRHYTQRLERSNKDLQDFAFIVSHDLQEPLRKVRGFGARLRDHTAGSGLDAVGQDYLRRVVSAAERMSTMIEDLLRYSRVATKAQPFMPVNLETLAHEVVSDLELRIEQCGGRVEIGPLPVIDADASQMRQVLQNLIANGLKFHPPGQPPLVRLRLHGQSPGWVELVVEDQGIGFDMAYAERIFQPFQRLHGRGEFDGSGMGLAICRKIAERHGGSIRAEGETNKGSRFYIRLPEKQN